MRAKVLLASAAVVVVACSKADTPPAADTSVPVAEEVSAAPISLAAVAGKWNFNVKDLTGDSVLTTHVLTASADPAGWSILQPTGVTVPIRNVTAAGDSITGEAGPFASGVRSGMQVRQLNSVYRLQDGILTGTTTARYVTTGPDSVRQFRLEGTRIP